MTAVRRGVVFLLVGFATLATLVVAPAASFGDKAPASQAHAIGVGQVYNYSVNAQLVRRDAGDTWFSVGGGGHTGAIDVDAFRAPPASRGCIMFKSDQGTGRWTAWKNVAPGSTTYMGNVGIILEDRRC